MCCIDCLKNLKYSDFYNFNHKTTHPLEEVVIHKNNRIINNQPIYPFNKINRLKLPKIIIDDDNESIIYDKNINDKQLFIGKLNKIILGKIKEQKFNNKKNIIENLLINRVDEIEFETLNNENTILRNRKNKIDLIDNEEWNIIE